jgi:hypothetical protein
MRGFHHACAWAVFPFFQPRTTEYSRMSKLHRDDHGLAEADTRKGELRNPGDRSDQPGQGADLAPPLDDGGDERDRGAAREDASRR